MRSGTRLINEYMSKNQSKSNLWTRIQNQINRVEPALVGGRPNPNHRQLKTKLGVTNTEKFNVTQLEFSMIREIYKRHEEEMCRQLGSDFIRTTYDFSEPIDDEALLKLIIKLTTKEASSNKSA
jgi:hypothetical protein